jgi:outer membrane receptor for ferrienterochelin and colicin
MVSDAVKIVRRNLLSVLLLLCLVTPMWIRADSEATGSISGTVSDEKTKHPLFGANIMVKNTLLGASVDLNGTFLIVNLPPGMYEVEASMIGYKKSLKKSVQIIAGSETSLHFELESTVLQQPAMIVTATKRKQPIENAPTSIDVITMRDIQLRSVAKLDEVLQNIPGFGIIKGQIDLRGSTGFNWSAGSRVLLMIDGHPFISGDSGSIHWDAIPVEEVESVEIVKGAGSALYGSNASGGMINIITKDPGTTPLTRLKLSWGFYDEPAYPGWRWTDRFLTYRISELKKWDPRHSLSFEQTSLSHSRQIGKAGLLLTFNRNRTSGYQQNGHGSRWNVLCKTKIHLTHDKTLNITGNWAIDNHGDVIEWLGQSRPMEVSGDVLGDWVRSEKSNLTMTFKHTVNQKFAYTLKGNAYRGYWKNFYKDDSSHATTDRMIVEAQFDYLINDHALTFGTEITVHSTRAVIYGNQQVQDYSLYIEDELNFSPAWALTAGTRFDHHWVQNVASEQQLSPRVGLVCRPREGTSFRMSGGYGFRAPSIAEVFANISTSGYHVVPNLDLKEAERVWSYEIGVRQIVGFPQTKSEPVRFIVNPLSWIRNNFTPHFIVDVAYFWSRYKNMIDVQSNYVLKAFQFVNLNRAKNSGVEMKIQASSFNNHITGTFGYTYIDPIDLDTGQTLKYRSKHRIVTGLQLQFWKLVLGLDYRYSSRIEEVEVYSGDERVPMHVMDGRAILELGRIQFSIEGKNLRNYHYTLRERMLEPIRSYVFTLRGTF